MPSESTSNGNVASGVFRCYGVARRFLKDGVDWTGLFEVFRFPVHNQEAVSVVFAVVGFGIGAVVALRIRHVLLLLSRGGDRTDDDARAIILPFSRINHLYFSASPAEHTATR